MAGAASPGCLPGTPRRDPPPGWPDEPADGGPMGSGVVSTAAGRFMSSGNGIRVSGLMGPPAKLIATIPA